MLYLIQDICFALREKSLVDQLLRAVQYYCVSADYFVQILGFVPASFRCINVLMLDG
jgi:hypothetical protein